MAFKIVSKNPEGSRLSFHDRAMQLAADYRRCEAELFEVIAIIDEKQIYFDLEIPSLFQYCVEMLKLSRHAAYDFITVVRKAKEIPQIREAILSERSTVSKLRKVCSVINEKNAAEWIGLTVECSSRIVEKAVAMANPRAAVPERLKYVSGDTLQFQLAVSEEWAELLGSVKDLMSQRECRAVSAEEALFVVMQEFKRKHDPVQKAERAERRNMKVSVATKENRTRYVPARVRHATTLRDQNRCAFVDRHGKRCTQTRWLQKHHIVHFAEGGEHSPENLQTLCWGHHCMAHR